MAKDPVELKDPLELSQPGYCVLFGIQHYDELRLRGPKYEDLPAVAKDVKRLRDVLKILGHHVRHNLSQEEDSVHDRHLTEKSIKTHILQCVEKSKPDGKPDPAFFLFYFSGHGTEHGGLTSGGQSITRDMIIDAISQPRLKGIQKIMIFDMCQGGKKYVVKGFGNSGQFLKKEAIHDELLFVYSSVREFKSFADPKEVGSIFTTRLAEELKNEYKLCLDSLQPSRPWIMLITSVIRSVKKVQDKGNVLQAPNFQSYLAEPYRVTSRDLIAKGEMNRNKITRLPESVEEVKYEHNIKAPEWAKQMFDEQNIDYKYLFNLIHHGIESWNSFKQLTPPQLREVFPEMGPRALISEYVKKKEAPPIPDWLRDLFTKLEINERHCKKLVENDITELELYDLTEDELIDLVPATIPRKRLKKYIDSKKPKPDIEVPIPHIDIPIPRKVGWKDLLWEYRYYLVVIGVGVVIVVAFPKVVSKIKKL